MRVDQSTIVVGIACLTVVILINNWVNAARFKEEQLTTRYSECVKYSGTMSSTDVVPDRGASYKLATCSFEH